MKVTQITVRKPLIGEIKKALIAKGFNLYCWHGYKGCNRIVVYEDNDFQDINFNPNYKDKYTITSRYDWLYLILIS